MRVLKHLHNGRLFLETPGLLKNRHLIPASPAESEAFLAPMREDLQKSGMDLPKQAAVVDLNSDIDVDMDVTFLGKGELIALANYIKVPLPSKSGVNDIRGRVIDGLARIKEARSKAVDPSEAVEQ